MLLQHALTELLIAKDYSLLAATRRAEALTEFIAWVTPCALPRWKTSLVRSFAVTSPICLSGLTPASGASVR